MKYSQAPLTPFLPSLPLTRAHRFLRYARPSRTAQALSAGPSIACALLNSLAALFAAAVLYFQSVAHSFAKHPGYGVPGRFCGLDRLNALSPLLLITSLQALHFHAITHSFAQRRPAKPCPLKRLRTLSITTGVAPPPLLSRLRKLKLIRDRITERLATPRTPA